MPAVVLVIYEVYRPCCGRFWMVFSSGLGYLRCHNTMVKDLSITCYAGIVWLWMG